MTATQVTRFELGAGVVMQVESWDQLPPSTRQELRLLGMKVLETLRPHQVSHVQLASSRKSLRDE